MLKLICIILSAIQDGKTKDVMNVVLIILAVLMRDIVVMKNVLLMKVSPHTRDFSRVSVHAWKTCNDNEEGKVIAKVDYKTKEIQYLNEAAKTDDYAQEVIIETLNRIDKR